VTETTAAPARSQAAGDGDAQARPKLRSSEKSKSATGRTWRWTGLWRWRWAEEIERLKAEMCQIAMANALLAATNDILQSGRSLARKKPTIGRAAAPDGLACAHQDRRSARYRRLLNPTDRWSS